MVSNISTSTSTTSLAVDGLISGLDTTSIIEQLVSVQTQRIERLEVKQAEETNVISLFQTLQADYLSLLTSADTLKNPSTFSKRIATSSNSELIDVGVSDESPIGSYQFTVNQLAKNDQHTTNETFADTNTTTVGAGTLTIQVGVGANSVTTVIAVDSSNNTLDGIADAINSSNAKVTASVIKVDDSDNPYKLFVTSDESGTINAVTLTPNNLSMTFGNVQTAQDAQIKFGTQTIERSSNVITDIIKGVTLTLKKIDTVNPVAVNVTLDKSGIMGAVNKFVDALNTVEGFIEEQSFFDSDTNTSGPLFGDPNLLNIRNRVSSIVNSVVGGVPVGNLRVLSQIGVTLSPETGSYILDSAELSKALDEKPEQVRDLFSAVGKASDIDIEVLSFTDKTKTSNTSGYSVNITKAATRAEIIGDNDLSSGLTVNETLTFAVDNVTVQAFLNSGDSAETSVSKINSAFKNNSVDNKLLAVIEEAGGQKKVVVRHVGYGVENSFEIHSTQDNSAGTTGLGTTILGQTRIFTGQDVAGTINGEAASGRGQVLTGNIGNANTDGLQLKVNLTQAAISSQGGTQGEVIISRGIGAQIHEFLNFLTDETQDGPIQAAIDQADTRIADLQENINTLAERAQRERERLLGEFSALESALGSLQTTSSFLEGQLQQIAATSQAIIKK